MRLDLVLKNGIVVSPGRNVQIDIAVKEGKIVALGRSEEFCDAAQTLDVTGKYILPGVIDVHCHFRDPGLTHKEDFLSGTRAAAMGGVTTVFDMPNTIPPVTNLIALHQKMKAIKNRAYVDYCLWGAVTSNDPVQIDNLAGLGVIGFKIFLAQTTGDLAAPGDGALLEVFGRIRATGLRAALHAEDEGYINYFTRKFQKEGCRNYEAVETARDATAEALAIARVLVLAHRSGNKIHIAHLSTREGAELVKLAREKGIDVSAETCPQYLLLKNDDYARLGQVAKMFPPLRRAGDMEALWAAIADGVVEVIASDHAPHTRQEKLGTVDIWDVPAGMIGVETSVPLMLEQVNRGRLTLNEYVRIACEKPARLFNLYPRKGTIGAGADADFTIIDLNQTYEIKATRLHSKSRFTPFEGITGKGFPVYTIVRGNVVMAHGRLLTEPSGLFVSP